MAELLDELQNAEFKEAFDEFDRVRKIYLLIILSYVVVNLRLNDK